MPKLYKEIRYATDEEWRKARTHGIGGSDVAAIMGLSKYKSPLEVWLEKTGRAESPDLSGVEAVEWGNRLEPLVAEKFASLHPELKVLRKNCTMVSIKRPWAFANIDRELRSSDGRRGILEIKTAGLRSADQWVFGVPDYYMTQVQDYLSVTGWDFAYVAVLIGGQEYREYYIERDEADIAAIDKAVDTFWNDFVVPEVMPQMTGIGDEGLALAQMYVDHSTDFIQKLDADCPQIVRSMELLRQIKALQEDKRLVDNEIKALIGDAKGIETETTRVNWIRTKEMRLDSKAIKKEMPEVFERFSNEKPKDMGLRFSAAKE